MLTLYTALTLKWCSSCFCHGLTSVENSIFTDLYFKRNSYKMLKKKCTGPLAGVSHTPERASHPEIRFIFYRFHVQVITRWSVLVMRVQYGCSCVHKTKDVEWIFHHIAESRHSSSSVCLMGRNRQHSWANASDWPSTDEHCRSLTHLLLRSLHTAATSPGVEGPSTSVPSFPPLEGRAVLRMKLYSGN